MLYAIYLVQELRLCAFFIIGLCGKKVLNAAAAAAASAVVVVVGVGVGVGVGVVVVVVRDVVVVVDVVGLELVSRKKIALIIIIKCRAGNRRERSTDAKSKP